jgi:ATP-dependent Lon protease
VQRMYAKLLNDNPAVRAYVDARLPDDVTAGLVTAMESGRDIDRTLRRMVGQALKAGERLSTDMLGEVVAQPVVARQKIGFV